MLLPKLTTSRFIIAWLIAPLLSVSPWLIFFVFLIAFQDTLLEAFIILYTGVLIFGIPASLIYEKHRVRRRLKFIIAGACFGQLTPLIVLTLDAVFKSFGFNFLIDDKFALGVALMFGSIHGALCAYFYHRAAYDIK